MPTIPAREQLWSATGVDAVLNAPGLTNQQRDYVMRLHSEFRRAPEIDADTLKLPVVYHRSEKHGHGRRYESPRGLQGAPGIVRRICSAKYYKDWDIENAYPVILEGKLKAAGIPCPTLSAYVAHREGGLSEVMAALGVTRKVAKELFIRSLHCGKWKNHDDIPAGATHRQLDDFAAEMRVASSRLAELPEYTAMWDIVKHDPERPNKNGSFVSLVCQVDEDKAITAAEEYLQQQAAVQVDALMFDGV
jgi:hypothetical protein